MVKIKVSEATGKALDWLVAKCEGLKTETWHTGAITVLFPDAPRFVAFNPSTIWAQGGPIIERERIEVYYSPGDDGWYAIIDCGPVYMRTSGDSPLVAAMRCFVASKLGEFAEVPAELTL